MYNIDFPADSTTVIVNKLFNNIQIIRGDVDICLYKGISVDSDTIKVAQALARDIQALARKGDSI